MRIIKKYEEFLKEAIYAPPPPPPPAIYSTMDMQNAEKADDSGNYMFQTGDSWGKDDNKAAENKKIDPSEWGIPDANLPETVEGWKSSNDPFIKAYSNYLNDSTGTQKGYVGKTLLIFQKKDGKELEAQYRNSDVNYIENGKIMNVQTEMTYFYVTKDAVKYKVESSFKDAKGNITIFTGEKATRSFDLASGQMLVKKQAHDKLVNGDLINTPVDREGKLAGRDDVTFRISYLPAAEPNSQTFRGKVDIFLNTNGKQLNVTDGNDVIFNSSVSKSDNNPSSNSPVILSHHQSRGPSKIFTLDDMGRLTSWEHLPEVFAKHKRTDKSVGGTKPYEIPTLGVPGVRDNQITPNIEGFGTVYAYNYIYKGTVNGNIIYKATTPSEVEDSFGNTAKGWVENGYYSVPLNTARWGYSESHEYYLAPSDDDVNVHQPFKTDAGKKALSSIVGKNGKQIEVKWDAKAKKFVSDLKVIKATLTDSQRRQMIN